MLKLTAPQHKVLSAIAHHQPIPRSLNVALNALSSKGLVRYDRTLQAWYISEVAVTEVEIPALMDRHDLVDAFETSKDVHLVMEAERELVRRGYEILRSVSEAR